MGKKVWGLEQRQGPLVNGKDRQTDGGDLAPGDRLKLKHRDGEIYMLVNVIDEDGLLVGRVIGTRGAITEVRIDDIIKVHRDYVSVIIRSC